VRLHRGNFDDENLFSHKHAGPGYLAMANCGTQASALSLLPSVASRILYSCIAVSNRCCVVVALVSAGPTVGENTNKSQFYIVFKRAPWLDGKAVVFGKVGENCTEIALHTPQSHQYTCHVHTLVGG
jgi:cyclophilin family peptidyl-prolyl cis-trans isomerase